MPVDNTDDARRHLPRCLHENTAAACSRARIPLQRRRGLPEPQLNVDVYSAAGEFLACVDLVFPAFKVAVEYQGQLHGARYAKDIERIEALRREGWIVIQVTSALIGRPEVLVARVREALESRGWRR